ncbi:MAG TPA: M1 family metallopeptidase [Steroidobacteraceae bacterium]|nr:M1 family metallopeptidase [Steroidobacteraceae bacterium]
MRRGQGCSRTAPRFIAALILLIVGTHASAEPSAPLDPRHDYHSYANTQQFLVEHAALDLNVDFAQRRLTAEVLLRVKRLDEKARELILDSRDLDVREVALVPPSGAAQQLSFTIGKQDAILGAPLTIALPPQAQGARQQVRIRYVTSPTASGLQWLEPQQTAGRKQPFLYSHSQPVHARSWIPLQDTPSVRLTYTARIRTPKTLRAVMSAANDPDAPRDGDYAFEMPQAVPSYLIAFAVGDLEFQRIGPRTGVYAEPSVVAAAAREFSDVETMLRACEQLFGPYRWGRYDLLILPPSFMWGGMENPRVSFITPTVLAGDKSLTGVIAHELAHSWSGNLVTNGTWRDTWLNEGFTTYLEGRIVEQVYGEKRRAMEQVLGLQALRRDIDDLNAKGETSLTQLAMDLRGRDPDDAFTDVSYEKGRLFLRFLDSRFGRERFDEFLRNYFAQFAFRSVVTEQFREYLNTHLMQREPGKVSLEEVDAWLYGPGIPATAVLPASSAFRKVDSETREWLSGKDAQTALPTKEWSTHEWVHFLDNLPQLSTAQMETLDRAFGLTHVQNAEIAHSWLLNVVRNSYEPGYARLEQFLTTVGRRKLVRDVYEALMKTPAGQARARQIYAEARPLYQVVLRSQLDALINEKQQATR